MLGLTIGSLVGRGVAPNDIRAIVSASTSMFQAAKEAVAPVEEAVAPVEEVRGLAIDSVVVHDLKVWPVFFAALASGDKTFELRRDDRGFAVGDRLRLREWSPSAECYTGREVSRVVTYKLSGPSVVGGIADGYCVLGLRDPTR